MGEEEKLIVDPDAGSRQRHTVSGLYRSQCNWCSWTSASHETAEDADTAMIAHFGNMHGVDAEVNP